MTSDQPAILLAGESVDLSGLDEPVVSYGRFRIENRGPATERVSVEDIWLEAGEDRQRLDRFTLFDENRDREIDPQAFSVAPGATTAFLVGFARRAYDPRAGNPVVRLKLRTGETALEAGSPVTFVRRIPRGS